MISALYSPVKSNNHVRLERLNKTVELRKQSVSEMSSKDTFKLAALNSIFRGVKHNDVTFLTGTQMNKLRKDPETSSDIEFTSVHENLKNIRTKFDYAKTQRIQLEKKVEQLKQERDKYLKAQQQFLSSKNSGSEHVQNLIDQVNRTKYMFQEKDIQKKVLLNMVDRLKKDKIFTDQKQFDLNKQLRFIVKQNQKIAIDGKGIFEESDRTKKLYHKFIDQLNEEGTQRQIHMESVANMISEKQRVLFSNESRGLQMSEIAQRAMQDKDENEKTWNKVLLAQKLVARLLRDKMNREMQKFYVVQNAFKNIKIATGVNEAGVFTYRFLNKQTVYGELLGKIAQNQRKIESLKIDADQLAKSHKELEQEEKQLYQMRKKQKISISKQQKQFDDIDEKKKLIYLKKSKLKLWLLRNLRKFKLMGEPIQKIIVTDSLEDLKAIFTKYLTLINTAFDGLQQEDLDGDIDDENLNPKMTDKIFRIKTQTKRKNSMGEEIDINFEEEYVMNPQEENENVDYGRIEVLRNNEKFMKMLKMKYQEIRRAKIEAMPKEKKKQIQKPKVVEPADD